ncbi:MAG TPA: general secretion pathway protein GspK [Rhodopirellula sp.]|nr:general secretion pathway protein GspK [Rhodopirellula sp.]
MRKSTKSARHGFFLVLVLIVVAIATMAVYSFTDLMLAYDDSAYLSGDIVQTRVNVESGAETVRLLLSEPPELRVDYGGVYNNPQLFQAVNVSLGDDNSTPSNFSILAPGLNDEGRLAGLRFGLQNESARLNINALPILENSSAGMMASVLTATDESEESSEGATSDNIAVSLLLTLPGMTEDIADAILDWLDEDEEVRPFGAEAEYYSTLPTPYVPKNGPVLSVEELLLVRGVTPTLLFGADANRNGVLDGDEQQRFGATVETAGSLGWAAYLTVHGAEASKRRDGSFRVNVNQDDLELLYEELSGALENDDYATFIAAYRIAGQSNSTMALLSGNGGSGQSSEVEGRWTADLMGELDLSGGGGTSLTQVLDLVGATVTIGNGDNAKTYSSPFSEDLISMGIYMPILMDTLTTQEVEVMPGRINLNECPAELLYGIPLLPEEAVEGILETRDVNSDDPNRQFETWPLVEGLVTLDEMRLLTPLVTCGGDVFRAQVVGYFEQSGVSSRSEVIIDATTVNPKIVFWRDLSHLGRGFDLSVLGSRSFIGLEADAGGESGQGN